MDLDAARDFVGQHHRGVLHTYRTDGSPQLSPVTAAVDDLQFLHPIKVGDLIILKARVTCAFSTSLEVQVDVFCEETLTGKRWMTSRAFLTFVAVTQEGKRQQVPPLLVETDDERRMQVGAQQRRVERLKRRDEATRGA